MGNDKELDALKTSLGLPDTPQPQVILETFSLKDNKDNKNTDSNNSKPEEK